VFDLKGGLLAGLQAVLRNRPEPQPREFFDRKGTRLRRCNGFELFLYYLGAWPDPAEDKSQGRRRICGRRGVDLVWEHCFGVERQLGRRRRCGSLVMKFTRVGKRGFVWEIRAVLSRPRWLPDMCKAAGNWEVT
jgi:hypothetical protein